MPTTPPVAMVSPSRIRRTASSALTILPLSGARSAASLACVATDIIIPQQFACLARPSIQTGQIEQADDDEARRGLGQGDHEDVLVGLAMGEAGDRQQRDDRAIVRQR